MIFKVGVLLFGATLISAQATPLTALISRFAQVPGGIDLDNGLVLWLDASNLKSTVPSPQGNVVNWQSSNNVNNQSLVFSAPSFAQAPQLTLAHSRFPGYPVSNLRFVRSLSQFYQFSPRPSQEFPTNFENGTTVFTLSAFGFSGSAGPATYERIFDFSSGASDLHALIFGRLGISNALISRQSNARCTTPMSENHTPAGESSVHRITVQPSGRSQLTRNGNETSNPQCDVAMGAYYTASRTATTFIGKSNWPIDELFEGSIGEILLWNKILNSTEMSFVYSYLNAKYFGCGAGSFGAYPNCTACPVNTFSSLWYATIASQCLPCLARGSTEGLIQRSACVYSITMSSRAMASSTLNFSSISMETALATTRTLSVSSTSAVLNIINNPISTSLGIQATGMNPILKPNTASAAVSTETSKLSNLSSSFYFNFVIYASATSGAVFLGISALLMYRRRRNKRQPALLNNVVQEKGIRQISKNLSPRWRNASTNALNTGLMYRPTNGMQLTGGPHLGQLMSKTGKNGSSFGPGGSFSEQGPEVENMLGIAQFSQLQIGFNPTTLTRIPNCIGIINSSRTFSAQHSRSIDFTATEQPQNFGNTKTVVPNSTLQF